MSTHNDIGYIVQHTAASLARQSEQMLQERLGIGFSQVKIMTALQWDPNARQRKIADSLGQTEASVSRQIKLMHGTGLLQTTINPNNRREHVTTLTTKGIRLSEEAAALLEQFHEPLLGSLSKRQQKHMLEALSLIHKSVCQSPDCQHRTTNI
ncbi:MAG: transcriptional regulator MarR family [Candidatus Saccharibacteria bacterium]|nr:transcriptional regulator MarR family [Candidatus Saccharibacteria bacterium]